MRFSKTRVRLQAYRQEGGRENQGLRGQEVRAGQGIPQAVQE